jgi:transcriptional regulator NrdR family protein
MKCGNRFTTLEVVASPLGYISIVPPS